MTTDRPLRVVLLGRGGVGKSCLCLKLTQPTSAIPETHQITPWNDTYNHRITLGGRKKRTTLLQIDDTAGQEEMFALAEEKVRDKDAVILVLSLADEASLDTAVRWLAAIKSKFEKPKENSKKGEVTLPIVLACNKSDLQESNSSLIKLTRQDIEKKIDLPPKQIIYTSAKTSKNVQELFKGVAELVLSKDKDSNCTVM